MSDWWADVERARKLGAIRYQDGERIIDFASPHYEPVKAEKNQREREEELKRRAEEERRLLFRASGTMPARD